MSPLKLIGLIVLWLSFSLAGGNAYAHAEHEATARTDSVAVHGEHANAFSHSLEKGCDHNSDGRQHPSYTTTCCVSCTAGVAVLSNPFVILPFAQKSEQFYTAKDVLLGEPLQSQDRPPKSLC